VNDCVNAEVRDALPDFINHRLSDLDAATVREHIESCAECQAEVAIIREARAGALFVPKMDADRIASAVRPYASKTAQSARRGSRRTWALAAAAAIVAIGGWAVSTRSSVDDSASRVAVTAAGPAAVIETTPPTQPEASVPSAQKSSTTRAAAPKEIQVASLSLVGTTDDLTDTDLENLVAALDGIDGTPSAEPGSVTTTVDDIDGKNDQ